MELTDQELAQLEDYYTNNLPEDQREQVKQRLAGDEEYKKMAVLFLKGIQALESAQLKTHLAHLCMNKQDPPKTIVLRGWWWAIAAGIVLTIGTWKIIHSNTFIERTKQLANQYFEPYLSTRGTAGIEDQSLSPGIAAYENQQFAKAIPRLKAEWENNKDGYTGFLLANAYLKRNRARLALPILIDIKDMEGVPSNWEWYLAITYLKLGKLEQAKISLRRVNSPEAKKILKKIMEG